MIAYRAIRIAPSNQFDSPSSTINVVISTATTTAATSSGANTSVSVVAVKKLSSTSSGASTQRDLQRAVDDDRERVVRLVAQRELDADDVLDRVAGDRDDHQTGERLRDVQRVDRRLERVDEPVGDQGGRDARDRQQRDREPERPVTLRVRVRLRRGGRGLGLGDMSRLDLRVLVPPQRRGQRQGEDDQQHDRDGDRQRLLVMRGRRVRLRREARQHQRGGGQRHQHARRARPADGEPLRAVLQAAHDERQAEHQQQVGQDRADDRRLDDDQVTLAQREERDEQLRQIAERALQHAGRAGTEAVAEPLDAAPDERGQHRDRGGGQHEHHDGVELGVEGDPGDHDGSGAAKDDHQVGAAECTRPAGRCECTGRDGREGGRRHR